MSSTYRESRRIPLDKIFFVIACIYLGVVVAWLVRERQRAENAKLPAISESDRRFINDSLSSLDAIDRRTPATTTAPPTVPAPSPAVSLPPPPPITTAAAPPAPRVIERVYVPVYPRTAPAARPPTPGVAVAPSPIVPSTVVPPALPVAPILPTSERIENTLVGVMELGDRSSALFDNKGVTTRISTGEFINGWTLIEVRSQQVILSRGGKTKVLEVGQSF